MRIEKLQSTMGVLKPAMENKIFRIQTSDLE